MFWASLVDTTNFIGRNDAGMPVVMTGEPSMSLVFGKSEAFEAMAASAEFSPMNPLDRPVALNLTPDEMHSLMQELSNAAARMGIFPQKVA